MSSTRKCPACGQENTGLHLDETGGWYICSKCGLESCEYADYIADAVIMPVYSLKEITMIELERGTAEPVS